MAVDFVNAVGGGGDATTLAITPGTGSDYQIAAGMHGAADVAYTVTFVSDAMDLLLSRLNDTDGSPVGLFGRSVRMHGLEGDYTGASRTVTWSESVAQCLACYSGVDQTSSILHSVVYQGAGVAGLTANISAANNPTGSRVVWQLAARTSFTGSLTVDAGSVRAQNTEFGDSSIGIGDTAGTGSDLEFEVSLPSDTRDLLLFVVVLAEASGGGPTIDTEPSAQTAILAGPWADTSVDFTAAATGETSTQWQIEDSVGAGTYSNVADGNGLTFSGGTTDALTVTASTTAKSGCRVRCAYTNGSGTTHTNAVALTIRAGEVLVQPTGTTNASGQFDTDGSLASDDADHPITIVRATCEGVTKDLTVVKVAP